MRLSLCTLSNRAISWHFFACLQVVYNELNENGIDGLALPQGDEGLRRSSSGSLANGGGSGLVSFHFVIVSKSQYEKRRNLHFPWYYVFIFLWVKNTSKIFLALKCAWFRKIKERLFCFGESLRTPFQMH